MIAGTTLNIFHNHADRVRMANLAQTVNVLQAVILTKEEKMLLTPTYHILNMYKVHQDATLLPMDIKSDDYILNGEKLPAISASASRDAKGITHISVVNIDAKKENTITIDILDGKYNSVTGSILKSQKLQDLNSFENPDKIKPEAYTQAQLKGGKLTIKLPPFSVVVLELK